MENNRNSEDDDMRPEYDFSKGERGKFYIPPTAVVSMPVYLEPEVESYLTQKADQSGKDLEDLVNDLLRQDIAIMEAGKSK
jgi:hypothetical protein